MNLLERIAKLQAKNSRDLTISELALVARYNSLLSLGLEQDAIVEKLESELAQSKEFRKNSVANTTTDAGGASEFVPETVLVGTLIDLADNKRSYAFLQAFAKTHQTLASKSTTVPILGRPGKAIVKTEKTSASAFREAKEALQSVNSGKVAIVAKMLYNNCEITDELSTFSIIELEALMLGRVREGILLSQADVIVNADDTEGAGANVNTHLDIAGVADRDTNPKYNFGKGLRAIGLSGAEGVTKIDIGALSGVDDILDLQALITSTSNPGEMIVLMDKKTYYAEMKQADFKDAAKNGKSSTIFSGALTNIAGSDVFVLDEIPLTASSGKVAASGNTKGTIIVADATVIQHGSYGEIKTNNEVDFAISQLLEAAGYWGMEDINGEDGINFVAVGYNCN